MTTSITSFNQSAKHKWDKRFLLVLLFFNLLGYVVTIGVYSLTNKVLEREKLKIFNQTSGRIQQLVEERMLAHVNVLRGLQALLSIHQGLTTKEEFNTYLDSLNTLYDYPGISSVAFIKSESEKLITTYLFPLEGRETALGLDQASQPGRKEFFDEVRDSGMILSSDPFTLVTTNRSGFFLAAPIYSDSEIPNSFNERQEKIIGFILLSFRETELFKAFFGRQNPFPDVDFAIYHNGIIQSDHLLYDSDPDFNPADTAGPEKSIEKTLKVTVGNTPWEIVVTTKPSFSLTPTEENLPKISLIIGLAISFILSLFILSSYRQHLKSWHC